MATNETVTLTAALKDEMSAPLDKAAKKVDGFTEAVVDGSKKQKAASDKSTAQITSNVDKTEKKYGGLLGVFAKVGGAGSKMFDGIGKGLTKASGGVTERAKKLGEGITDGIKDGLKIGSVGIATAITGGIALAVQKSNAESLLTASMGLSPDEAARVGKISGQLYASGVGEGMDDINTALEATYKSFGRFGTMSNEELAGASTRALAVAQILGVDVTRAAQVAGTMVRNELAGNATEAFDLITAASQNAAAGMGGDVLDAVDEYATFFTSLGFSGTEAMGMLSEASHGGIQNLDKMGDAIKEFGIRATDGSKATSTAFETIGMRGDVMANKFLEGGPTARKAFKEVTDALLSVKDPATRAQTAIALFGTPMEDMDVTLIPAFLQSMDYAGQGMENFAGRSQVAADTLNSGPGFVIEKFKREALGSLSEFAEKAVPYIEPFFDWLRGAKDWLPQLIVPIGGVVGALMVLNGVLAITGALGWPVTLVVLALAALAAAAVWAYNNVDWFRAGVDAAFKWIGEAAVNVWNWIQLAFTNVVSFWQTNVMPVLNFLGQVFANIFDWIGRLVWNAITIVVKIFTELTSFWQTEVQPVVDVVGKWFSEVIGGAVDGLKPVIDGLISNFNGFIKFWTDTLKPITDEIAKAFGVIGDYLGKFANNPFGGLQDVLGIKKDENGQGIMPTTPGASGGGVFGGKFAGGGVLGGYAPGHDSILARLSPGESVLVPELTRAIGPSNIIAANAAASGGRPAGAGPSLTSGFSNSRSGGASINVGAINFHVPVTNAGQVDLDAMREAAVGALEDALAAHNRRAY
jgi:phage-related minor tail protein